MRPPGLSGTRTDRGGVVIDPARPHRWLPGFRMLDYDRAPVVNVGSTLLSAVIGPLNYRSEAYQIVARGSIEVGDARPVVQPKVMVETLPPNERYDYNHRGQLQVLMHGVVSKQAFDAGAVEYEVLHGNELNGVDPGSMSGKASDHAYVLARVCVGRQAG